MNKVSQSLCESIAVQIQEVTKVGRLFVNTQISAAALIKLLSVKVRRLFESGAYSSSGA